MKLVDFPLIRTTGWFVLGIITAYYFRFSGTALLLFVSVSLIFLGYTYFVAYKKMDNYNWFSIALYFAFFVIGSSVFTIHKDAFYKNHYSQFDTFFSKNHTIELVIEDKLRDNKKYNRYISKIKQIDGKSISGKVLLNINKEELVNNFVSGTRLRIDDQLVKNFNLNNPNQFDYSNYLESKNIYAQIYAEPSQIEVNQKAEKSIFYYASTFRNTIIKNLEKTGFAKNELAVIIALILGQQQDISKETITDYQYAGAVHILSVSGLHVGFILLFISFLLKPLPNTRFWNTLKLIISLTCLWLFAITAGLVPSVVRSAVMFSFVAIGSYLNKPSNMYHTLVVSLFIILLFEPNFLFDVGFQLSYLALFFIVWLQPMLKSIWQPKYKVASYFWDIITVSFAAQIGTLPLSIYYFHQFPGLFFVTNMVLIPALVIIMALGVLLVLLAYFDWIPLFLSKSVEWLVWMMNCFINRIASVEDFILKEIPFTFTLLLISYITIIAIILWFKKPNYRLSVFTLLTILCFQIILFYTNWSMQNREEMIVFNSSTNTIITSRTGNKVCLYTTDKLQKEDFNLIMVKNYATAHFSKIETIEKMNNLLYFNGKKILIVNNPSIAELPLKPDVLILIRSPKLNLDRLLKIHQPKIIIADATNYKTYVEKWEQTCKIQKIPFHSVYKNGFYKLE